MLLSLFLQLNAHHDVYAQSDTDKYKSESKMHENMSMFLSSAPNFSKQQQEHLAEGKYLCFLGTMNRLMNR